MDNEICGPCEGLLEDGICIGCDQPESDCDCMFDSVDGDVIPCPQCCPIAHDVILSM